MSNQAKDNIKWETQASPSTRALKSVWQSMLSMSIQAQLQLARSLARLKHTTGRILAPSLDMGISHLHVTRFDIYRT